MKRSFDIAVSGTALLLLSPLLFIIILLLRFTGEGEVFFGQERIGYRGRAFRITKFATMKKSAAVLPAGEYTVENDPRVLPVGRFLRKFKVNEIIQLWDVFRGEMSLVGPRPQLPRMHRYYPTTYMTVLNRCRPGITGVGSLVFRDEEAIIAAATDRDYCYTHQIIPYKAELEEWYAANRTFTLDLKLIALTAWHVIRPRSKALWNVLPVRLRRDMNTLDGVR